MSVRRSTGFLATLAVVIVLLLGEALVRVAETVRDDIDTFGSAHETFPWYVDSPELGWEHRPSYAGFIDHDWREFNPQGFLAVDTHQLTDATKPKVLFIGDSNTFGFGVSTDKSFVEVVDGLLPGVAAINLGVNGYSSYQGRVMLERHLERLKPAAVVASFNFNDRRAANGEAESDGRDYFERMYRLRNGALNRVVHGLEAVHLYRALRSVMRRLGLIRAPVREFSIAQLAPRVSEYDYRRNLAAIAAATRRLGIPLIFLSLRDNPLDTGALRKGIASSARGDHEAAIEYLTTTIRARSWFAYLARIHLVGEYRARGDSAKAEEILLTRDTPPMFGDGRSIRLDSTYNDIMRDVARDSGAELVDGAVVLDQDPFVYIDFCHFNAIGHQRIGELLARRIERLLAVHKTSAAAVPVAR
ncbi:MAG: hypothetical protein A2W18_02790 [Candidatus Muproteobacteria bacterium RBG_16_60_9]|uniref:SGNH hydrolase-type esterase domain-containing protein n=1 Tax=Candidatus Muproteobacteria bacterium RBG_16_60_9 TaxID=1817755 RepID=A0A1F6UZB7_9PROT|nr:MAG: hypothetical protein A2W18_02790 [Candidatus Muproteobacteria bacterium RBG_16_60_9]